MSENAETGDPHDELPFEPFETSQNRILLLYLFLFAIPFAAFFIHFAPVSRPESYKDYERFFLGWFFIVTLTSFCMFLLAIVVRPRKLTVASTGLTLKTLFKTREWNWSDIGPLNLDIYKVRFKKLYFVCAFTANNQRLLSAIGSPRIPSNRTADIVIPLGFMPEALDAETAQSFVEKLNRWREAYGAFDETPCTPRELVESQKIESKISRRIWLSVALPALLLLALFVLFQNAGVLGKLIAPLFFGS